MDHYEAIEPELCEAISAMEPICKPVDDIETLETEDPKDGDCPVGDVNDSVTQETFPPDSGDTVGLRDDEHTLSPTAKNGPATLGKRHVANSRRVVDYQIDDDNAQGPSKSTLTNSKTKTPLSYMPKLHVRTL